MPAVKSATATLPPSGKALVSPALAGIHKHVISSLYPLRSLVCKVSCLWVLLAGSLISIHAAEPLRLSGSVAGSALENVAVKNGQIVATFGKQSGAVPRQAEWKLTGDLRANAHLLYFSPPYSTEGMPPPLSPQRVAPSKLTHAAKLTLLCSPDVGSGWPQRAFEGAIAVFVWILDGEPVGVFPLAATQPTGSWTYVAHREIHLTETEHERGFPAILLWKEGGFIAPEPWFRETEANQWLIDAHFPPARGLAMPSAPIAQAATRHGVTLLHIAAESGLDSAIGALVAAGANANASERTDSMAAHWAARCGRTGALTKLVTAGANLDRAAGDGEFPLYRLICARHDAGSAALVKAGVRYDRTSDDVSYTELALDLGLFETLRAIATHGSLKPLRARLDRRLAMAVRAGDATLTAFLLEQGAEPTQRGAHEPPLVAAARSPDTRLLKLLLAAGADANAVNREGTVAVAIAARSGHTANVTALLAAGADPNRPDRTGRTPLHFAIAANAGAIQALLKAGAAIVKADRKGVTPLDLALARQSRAAVEALLHAGARIDLKAKAAPRMLADAVLLDLPELLERAAADGWSPHANSGRSYSPAALARYARAANVIAWLQTAAVTPGAAIPTAGPGDQPPQAAVTKAPNVARNGERDYPAATVMVTTIIEADGTLSHTIAFTDDDELRSATLESVRAWQFKPGRKNGKPSAMSAKFPVIFSEIDNRIHALAEVEMPADARPLDEPFRRLAQELENVGIHFANTIRVGFIVEKDGKVRDLVLPENLRPSYAVTLRQTVTEAQFSPGRRDGQPVRTWVEMPVGYDVRMDYGLGETYRFESRVNRLSNSLDRIW